MAGKAINFFYNLLRGFGLTVCLAACFFDASAQKDTTRKLKEVVISSDTADRRPTATPSQQIKAVNFDAYGAFSVADAVRNFAGVNIKDYGGIGGLKTVSVRALGANHLAVLYDGIALNDAENGQVDLGKLNLNNIQEIRLYNGQPTDLLQPATSFAFASVLSIKTTQPALSPAKPFQIIAGIKGGSFGLVNPYIQWQQRLSKRWSFVINSYLESADGQYKFKETGDGSDTLATRHNAGVSTQQADGALYWIKNDSNQFNFHVNYYQSDRGLPNAVIYYNPYSRQRLHNQDFFAQAGYKYQWAAGLQLLANAKLSESYTRYIDPDFLKQGGLDDRYTERLAFGSVALAYGLNKNWKISFSNDASLNDLKSNKYNYVYPTRFILLNVVASTYKFGSVSIEGSILHTFIDDQVKSGSAAASISAWSPTVVATLQPFASPYFKVRAFYKDIFRNPTFDELYFFAVNNSRNLKPEYAKQFDLGATYTKNLSGLLEYITASADAYDNTVTNKIIALPNKNPDISSILNLGKVDIKGVDLTLKTQAKIAPGCKATLAVNYTFEQALDVTDPTSSYYENQIPYTPKNTLALNGGFKFNHFTVNYNQVISSSRYYLNANTPENFVPGYAVSDASAIYHTQWGGKTIALSAEVNNLFNTNYVIVRSYPMPGRSYRLSVQITI
jgi:outer membrane cobalamin receptor